MAAAPGTGLLTLSAAAGSPEAAVVEEAGGGYGVFSPSVVS